MAFLQPQTPRQPIFQAPAIVLWLIGTLAGAHGLRMLVSDDRSQDLIYTYGFVPARYSRAFLESHMYDPGTVPERVIPFVSYMGLHSDITHLFINCLWLLAFGPIVARRWGSVLFLVFFTEFISISDHTLDLFFSETTSIIGNSNLVLVTS